MTWEFIRTLPVPDVAMLRLPCITMPCAVLEASCEAAREIEWAGRPVAALYDVLDDTLKIFCDPAGAEK